MTGPGTDESDLYDDSERYDDLAESAAREQADRLAARRFMRGLLLTFGVSVSMVLLAATVVSLLLGPMPHPQIRDDAGAFEPDTSARPWSIPDRDRTGTAGKRLLAAITLPAWWLRGPVSFDPGGSSGPATWTAVWTGPKGSRNSPAAVSAALTAAGWQQCSDNDHSCWQRFPYFLTLTWGVGGSCPTITSCHELSVVLVDVLGDEPEGIVPLPGSS